MKTKNRLIVFIVVFVVALMGLSARTLVDYVLPFDLGTIKWPEVTRFALETERDSFELEGPNERFFEISLEGELEEKFRGDRAGFLSRELKDNLGDELEDLREDRYDYEVLVEESDENHYYYLVKVEDRRLGEFYVSALGVLNTNNDYLEFSAEFNEEDRKDVDSIVESLLAL